MISTRKFAEIKNKSPLRKIEYTLQDVNGNDMTVYGSADILVRLGSENFDLPFIVCDLHMDGLLGQDFPKEHVESISYRQSCLIIQDKQIPLWTGGESVHVCRVEVKETVQLPPKSRMWLSVNVPQAEYLSKYGFVEPSLDVMAKK